MEKPNSEEETKRGAELLEKLANPKKDREETVKKPKENLKEEKSTKPTEDQRKKIEELARKIINRD